MNTSGNAIIVQAVVSALLAVALDWMPGLAKWWHPLPEASKKLYMALMLLISMIALAAIECVFNDRCPVVWTDYILELVGVYLGSLAINQSAHAITKPGEQRVEKMIS